MSRYIVAETTEIAHRLWDGLAHRMGPITAQQSRLIALVQKHLDAGVFYESELCEKVVADLGDDLTPEDWARGRTKVEDGYIGYEVYLARKFCDAVKYRLQLEAARDRLALHVGKKLGSLIFGFDYKLNSACVVIEVSQGGKSAKIQAKRGKNVLEITADCVAIESAMERVTEKKALKAEQKARAN